jgi:hypothetical protein
LLKSEVAREILAYLSDHPEARDTLEGIVHWWMLERKIRSQIALVREAIQELVEKGFLLEEPTPGAEKSYQVNPKRQGEIQRLVRTAGSSSSRRVSDKRKRTS